MEDALKDEVYEYAKELEKHYDDVIHELEKEIRSWYQRFADNNGLTYADAQKLLNKGELEEFKWSVEEYIKKGKESAVSGQWLKELENASARVHISRLDALKQQVKQAIESVSAEKESVVKQASELMYKESFQRTAYEVQKGIGVGWNMASIDDERLEKVLSKPWTSDDKTFSQRIWEDKNKLIQNLEKELTRMIATGEAPDKAIANIAKNLNVSKRNAGRTVMTESAYFASAAQKDCFNELDVEEYCIVSALDGATCETCGAMDRQVFKMSQYDVGSTAPPFHPWCRCCTAPWTWSLSVSMSEQAVYRRYPRAA